MDNEIRRQSRLPRNRRRGSNRLAAKEEAEWMRDMLCVALAKIVADATPTLP